MGSILASLFMSVPKPEENPATLYNTPLPSIIHKVITHEEINGRQVLIVGDIHGCFDELVELVTKSGIDPKKDVIIFCGDIVNKGPKSTETLKYIKSLPNAFAIRGNHEEAVMRELKALKRNPESHNKDMKQKYQWLHDLHEEDFSYLIDLPYSLSIPSLNVIVVHGGIFPWKPLEQQKLTDLTQMRNIMDGDGPAPEATKKGDGLPWASYWMGPQHIYFGHDAARGLQRHRFATGLDSGCVYGGKLTGKLVTGTKEFVFVQARQTYRVPKT